jgi:hypothetical protein
MIQLNSNKIKINNLLICFMLLLYPGGIKKKKEKHMVINALTEINIVHIICVESFWFI